MRAGKRTHVCDRFTFDKVLIPCIAQTCLTFFSYLSIHSIRNIFSWLGAKSKFFLFSIPIPIGKWMVRSFVRKRADCKLKPEHETKKKRILTCTFYSSTWHRIMAFADAHIVLHARLCKCVCVSAIPFPILISVQF